MVEFVKCKPEEVQIASEYLDGLVKKLRLRGVDMHSLLVARGSRLVFEKYYNHKGADSLNRLFSITKSFTAVGVGLLIDEGKVELDAPIIGYFPEKVSGEVHPWVAEMTVRNCLMMRTCYEKTTYNKFDMNSDWVASFFNSKPTHRPGMMFHYDTGAAHTLCALVEKLSGMKLTDYIRYRLPELGLSKEAYVIEGSMGVSQGGSGLMASPYDMLRFGRFIMDRGAVCGKQLMSSSYIEMLVSNLTPTKPTAAHLFESCGYGCQFWRFKHGACCYGMGGQMIFMDEKHDLIVVTTADTQGHGSGMQAIHDAVNEELIEKLAGGSEAYENHRISVPGACRKYRAANDGDFSEITLLWDDKSGYIEYNLKGRTCRIPFAFTGVQNGIFPGYNMECSASAEWLSESMLYIYVRLLDESLASVRFTISMDDCSAVLYMKKTEETMFSEYSGHYTYELQQSSE